MPVSRVNRCMHSELGLVVTNRVSSKMIEDERLSDIEDVELDNAARSRLTRSKGSYHLPLIDPSEDEAEPPYMMYIVRKDVRTPTEDEEPPVKKKKRFRCC